MNLNTVIDRRHLLLAEDGSGVLDIALDHGGRHRLIAPDMRTMNKVIDQLEALPNVAILPSNGGLLGAMTVAENLSLALRYDLDPADDNPETWTHALLMALKMCGLSKERIRRIGRERPMNLDRIERWIIGFVRYLLRPPELLVLDRTFAGLSRRQAENILAAEAVFHEFHPFRPALFADIDSHELPAVPNCRQQVELNMTEHP